jgi:hypothetical protein
MTGTIPHIRVVIAFCVAALVGYAFFSVWVVLYSGDAALRGDVIGTWKSFATAGVFFWIGSSSGGKAKPDAPTPVSVVNPPESPVPVEPTP